MLYKKKVSLKDIAEKAGVSTALVSYVLNGKGRENRVRKEKAEKIRKIAKDLNYQPNHLAKSLRSGKSHTIGLVIADISNPFFANIARVVENQARHYGYTVIYGSSDEDASKSKDLVNVLMHRSVDGLIIVSSENTEKQVLELTKQPMPFVLLDRYFPEIKTDYVSTNNHKAAMEAGLHLLDMQYKNIAFIGYDSKLFHMKERIRGYKDALKEKKRTFQKQWLHKIKLQRVKNDIGPAIDKLIKGPEPADAIIFATYSLAVHGLKYMNQKGIKVPDQFGIVSFGQTELFDLYSCPITYVMQDMENLGKYAVEILMKKMKNPNEKIRKVLLDAKLIKRQSSGKKAS